MPADRTPLLFDLPKAQVEIKPNRKGVTDRVAKSRWLDRHTGLLFNEASPRTFRVSRDLRREARPDVAVDLGNWQYMRPGAASDDRLLWRSLHVEGCLLRRRLITLQDQLGKRARLQFRRRRGSEIRTYVFLGRRGVRAVNVRSGMLREAGIRSLTMPIKEFGRAELALNEKVGRLKSLADEIERSWIALQSVERRLGQDRKRPLIFPPLIASRLARLRSYRARGVEILGTYCPTPHIQFEGWRIRMLAYADALKASVMTLNKFYNLYRNRKRARYGKRRRVKFGLMSRIAKSSWLLPRLEWCLIKRTRNDGNIIAYKTVKGLMRVRGREWRETGSAVPVANELGRLNPGAVALCHQPEMYPLLQPFDEMVARFNAEAQRVLAHASGVIGTRPTVHPFGAQPRAEWKATIKARWWV